MRGLAQAGHSQATRVLVGLTLAFAVVGCERHGPCDLDVSLKQTRATVDLVSFPDFRDGRQCWVFVPKVSTSQTRFPVLYMFDGDRVFNDADGWHAAHVVQGLVASHRIQPLIIVGIASLPGFWRQEELYPFGTVPHINGDAFIRGIRDSLKPRIDALYPTLPDRDHTYVGGASLGGLMAAYAGYTYDSTFSRVLAMSPSYAWGLPNLSAYAQDRPKPRLTRFSQDTGSVNDNSIAAMQAVAVAQGFVLNADLRSVVVIGAEHRDGCWAARFPDALEFISPP